MDALNRLRKRLNKATAAIKAMTAEFHEESRSETEAAEFKTKLDRAIAERESLKTQIADVERVEAMEERRIARRDRSPGQRTGAGALGALDLPTVDQMLARDRLLRVAIRGRTLSDENLAIASEIFPVEQLYARHMMDQARRTQGLDPEMESDQRKAWAAYRALDRQVRAISNGLASNTAGEGDEYVPAFLDRMIQSERVGVAPLGGDDLVTVRRTPSFADYDLPGAAGVTVTQLGTDGNKGEGLDIPSTQVTTSVDKITAKKLKFATEWTYEFAQSDATDFIEWLAREVGQQMALRLSNRRSEAMRTGATGVDVGANNALTLADVRNLFKALPSQYFGMPTTRCLMNGSTEITMRTIQVGGSNTPLAFQAETVDGELRLFRGVPAVIDDSIEEAATASVANDDIVMVLGECARVWAVEFGGGIRNYTRHRADEDDTIKTVFLTSVGEVRVDDNAVRNLIGKA